MTGKTRKRKMIRHLDHLPGMTNGVGFVQIPEPVRSLWFDGEMASEKVRLLAIICSHSDDFHIKSQYLRNRFHQKTITKYIKELIEDNVIMAEKVKLGTGGFAVLYHTNPIRDWDLRELKEKGARSSVNVRKIDDRSPVNGSSVNGSSVNGSSVTVLNETKENQNKENESKNKTQEEKNRLRSEPGALKITLGELEGTTKLATMVIQDLDTPVQDLDTPHPNSGYIIPSSLIPTLIPNLKPEQKNRIRSDPGVLKITLGELEGTMRGLYHAKTTKTVIGAVIKALLRIEPDRSKVLAVIEKRGKEQQGLLVWANGHKDAWIALLSAPPTQEPAFDPDPSWTDDEEQKFRASIAETESHMPH